VLSLRNWPSIKLEGGENLVEIALAPFIVQTESSEKTKKEEKERKEKFNNRNFESLP